jgi:hypothetical protein
VRVFAPVRGVGTVCVCVCLSVRVCQLNNVESCYLHIHTQQTDNENIHTHKSHIETREKHSYLGLSIKPNRKTECSPLASTEESCWTDIHAIHISNVEQSTSRSQTRTRTQPPVHTTYTNDKKLAANIQTRTNPHQQEMFSKTILTMVKVGLNSQ